MESNTVVVDGIRMRWEERGSGTPARIVWGDADQFEKLEYGERLARDLRAPLGRIPGGNHFTREDHPDVIAEEIEALLTTAGEGWS